MSHLVHITLSGGTDDIVEVRVYIPCVTKANCGKNTLLIPSSQQTSQVDDDIYMAGLIFMSLGCILMGQQAEILGSLQNKVLATDLQGLHTTNRSEGVGVQLHKIL